MSWVAIVLIVISAFMHASWNFISKQHYPTVSFFFVAAVSASTLVAPLLFIYSHIFPLIPISVWGLVLATGLAQAIYFSGLAGAYRLGDMSLAYPLARALPVLSIAAISIVLGNGSEISPIGLVGMVLISAGCIILPLPTFRRLRRQDYLNRVYLMAVMAAVGTTAYTLIDDAALRQLRHVGNIPLNTTQITVFFIALQTISTATLLGLTLSINRTERQQLIKLLHHRSLLISSLSTGVIIMAAYGLVLVSMAYARNVSYVAAFRQLSIPIGAILGLTLQKEARNRPKLAGIAIISIGLIFVGVG